jgi:hypothetical protein
MGGLRIRTEIARRKAASEARTLHITYAAHYTW